MSRSEIAHTFNLTRFRCVITLDQTSTQAVPNLVELFGDCMRVYPLLLAIVCLIGISTAVHAMNPVYSAPTRYERVNARILALSNSVHTAAEGNEETYIAEIWWKPDSAHHLVKLVDNYPSYEVPIRHALLVADAVFRMKVSRTEGCDSNPADGSLLPSKAKIFVADQLRNLEAGKPTTIPCFQVDHEATQIAKGLH